MKRKQILGILILVWMAVIFFFSSQVADDSATLSGSITYRLLSIFYPAFLKFDPVRQIELLHQVNFFVRKAAHMTEFGILFLLCRAYQGEKYVFWQVLLFCFLYAVTDEIHQAFVPGRGPAFTDVLIDTSGAALFSLLPRRK